MLFYVVLILLLELLKGYDDSKIVFSASLVNSHTNSLIELSDTIINEDKVSLI